MLAFLSLFLKFYLADTPHRRMRSILEVGSEQLHSFYLFSKSKHLYYITTVIFRKVISFYAKNGNHFLPLISS